MRPAYREHPVNAGHCFHCFSPNRPQSAHAEIATDSGLKSGHARIQGWGQREVRSCLPHRLTLPPLNYGPEAIVQSALLQQGSESFKRSLNVVLCMCRSLDDDGEHRE